MVRLMGLRDAMMADNLRAVAERERRARRGPTLVHAHNRHLQRDESLWLLPPGWGPLEGRTLRWWSAGAVVGAQLGDEYAFVASALGAAPHQGLDAPHPDTLEGILSTLPGNRYVVDSAGLARLSAPRGPEPVPRAGCRPTTATSRWTPAGCAVPTGSSLSSTSPRDRTRDPTARPRRPVPAVSGPSGASASGLTA